MLKKLLLTVAIFAASIGFAFAQVDVNKADQAALDGIKGIGPATSKTILDERKKGGNFKDWADFEKRVKGIGDKRGNSLSKAGLMVNGQAKTGASATGKEAKKNAKADAKEMKAEAKKNAKDAKAEAKKDVKDMKADAKKESKASDVAPAAKK